MTQFRQHEKGVMGKICTVLDSLMTSFGGFRTDKRYAKRTTIETTKYIHFKEKFP